MGHVEISIEEATRICLLLGIPFLIMIKAHTLREKQSVKLRSVRDIGVPDTSVLLGQLARTVLERLAHLAAAASSSSSRYHHHHHHHPQGAGGRGADALLLLPSHSVHSPGDMSGSHHHHHHHHHTPSAHHHHHHFLAAHHHHQPTAGGVEIVLNCLDRSTSGSDRRKVGR